MDIPVSDILIRAKKVSFEAVEDLFNNLGIIAKYKGAVYFDHRILLV